VPAGTPNILPPQDAVDHSPLGHIRQQRELILLCRQLGAMLDAGTDILRALLIIREQVFTPALRQAMESAYSDMGLGATLAASLARYPHLFTPFFLDMVRQGEGEGALGEGLQNLADYLEKELRVDIQVGSPLAGQEGPGLQAGMMAMPSPALFRLAVWLGAAAIIAAVAGAAIAFTGQGAAAAAVAMLAVGCALLGWGLAERRNAGSGPATAPQAFQPSEAHPGLAQGFAAPPGQHLPGRDTYEPLPASREEMQACADQIVSGAGGGKQPAPEGAAGTAPGEQPKERNAGAGPAHPASTANAGQRSVIPGDRRRMPL
jgi:hypothetical protein